MEKIPMSVVIIAKNEQDNIENCLKSVSWANELIVVDDYSSDDTVNIARQFTDKIFLRKMENEGVHRNYAYSMARNNWVLSIDADERASEGMKKELETFFKTKQKDIAYSFPIKTYIGNRWIRYGGWYPADKIRLFDKRFFKYEEAEVHPGVRLDGTWGRLKSDIVHYSYGNFHDYFASLNNQTTLEAKKWFRERRKIGFLKMQRKFIHRFLKSYIQCQGFRDGLVGFMIAYGGGLYQLMSYVKYREMLQNEKDEKKI